jgi:hypothetical protein
LLFWHFRDLRATTGVGILDMIEVVPQAYEMVGDGLATAHDFRDFTFANV